MNDVLQLPTINGQFKHGGRDIKILSVTSYGKPGAETLWTRHYLTYNWTTSPSVVTSHFFKLFFLEFFFFFDHYFIYTLGSVLT